MNVFRPSWRPPLVLLACLLGQVLHPATTQPHEMASDNLRVYVAELPPEFELPLEEPGSIWNRMEGEVWSSDWRSNPRWFAAQMRASPLRVHSLAHADVVFVPVVLNFWQKKEQWVVGKEPERMHINAFMDGARGLLPALGRLPHIAVLQVTGKSYDHAGTETDHIEDLQTMLFRHENSPHFTFITTGPWFGKISTHAELGVVPTGLHGLQTWTDLPQVSVTEAAHCPGCIGTVYPQTYHWSLGTPEWEEAYAPFDPSICERKTLMAAAAFITRPNFQRLKRVEGQAEREALRNQCNGSDRCRYIPWDWNNKLHATIRGAMLAAWYSIHPIGDNIIRGAMYDSMIAYALPVVFTKEVAWQLPYTDVIDYSDMVSYIDPRSILPDNANSMNLMDIVESQFNQGAMCRKLEVLHKIRPVMQFSLTPMHHLITFANMSNLDVGEDAFTFTMKGVLRHLCRQGWRNEKCDHLSIKLKIHVRI